MTSLNPLPAQAPCLGPCRWPRSPSKSSDHAVTILHKLDETGKCSASSSRGGGTKHQHERGQRQGETTLSAHITLDLKVPQPDERIKQPAGTDLWGRMRRFQRESKRSMGLLSANYMRAVLGPLKPLTWTFSGSVRPLNRRSILTTRDSDMREYKPETVDMMVHTIETPSSHAPFSV